MTAFWASTAVRRSVGENSRNIPIKKAADPIPGLPLCLWYAKQCFAQKFLLFLFKEKKEI